MALVGLQDVIDFYGFAERATLRVSQISFAHTLRIAASLKKLSTANADVWSLAHEFANGISKPQPKALFLATLAEVMMEEGRNEEATIIWRSAMRVAASTGLETILEVLGHGARILAPADGGLVLKKINDEVLTDFGGAEMSVFDQRGQHVTYQYNSAGDIDFGRVDSRSTLIRELGKLQQEIGRAKDANALPDEAAVDAEYHVNKAVLESKKENADKASVVGYLSTAKKAVESIVAAGGLVSAMSKAVELAQKLF
jgi:hypothetical protein